MRPLNPMSIIPKYAKDSTYISGPTQAQQEAGMIPLDTVPADWWNMLFQQLSEQVNNACNGMTTAYNEILNVLSAANIQPDAIQNDQLAQAINNLRQTVANATNAGAVKSSTTSGKVSVDGNGIMTPNGMGVPTTLNTVNKEIVSAINELKSAYDQAIQTINDSLTALGNNKAPNDHASSATTYGVGDGTKYGHLKISDTYNSQVGAAADGVAASQKAVYDAYMALSQSALVIAPGLMFPFAGPDANIPAGYLLCNGRALLQASYPQLFAAIGTEYNLVTDDPNTTFRLPNQRYAPYSDELSDYEIATDYSTAPNSSTKALTASYDGIITLSLRMYESSSTDRLSVFVNNQEIARESQGGDGTNYASMSITFTVHKGDTYYFITEANYDGFYVMSSRWYKKRDYGSVDLANYVQPMIIKY